MHWPAWKSVLALSTARACISARCLLNLTKKEDSVSTAVRVTEKAVRDMKEES